MLYIFRQVVYTTTSIKLSCSVAFSPLLIARSNRKIIARSFQGGIIALFVLNTTATP